MELCRIVVVGTTGSGKTTLASRLSQKLGMPHIEMDALNWGPNWTMRPEAEFRSRVDKATLGDTWVVDGNYSRSRDIVWPRADTIVWLDYPLYLVLWHLWWRIWGRWYRDEILWHGNKERLRIHFTSRDSLFVWALQTYRRRKREYPLLFEEPQYSHLNIVRLHSPKRTEEWLAELKQGVGVSSDRYR